MSIPVLNPGSGIDVGGPIVRPLLYHGQTKMDHNRMASPHCAKVFIQRDYSNGTHVKFLKDFPPELEGKIDRQTFDSTVTQLNTMFAEAEMLCSSTYCENCFACLTAYLIYLCMDTHYEKMLKKINRYIQEQNDTVFVPRGLMLVDPSERGLRVIEICILTNTNLR
ncbi:Golgin subfamily A member 7B [Lamellibrachia satsuma]|nr:Golgin subfamily A member 7B [Lamellibrachia satsuma]